MSPARAPGTGAPPGPDAGAGPDHRRLAEELVALEVRTLADLGGIAEDAADLRARAAAAGWAHGAERARLLVADAAARADRMEHGAQEQRDVLVEAMLAGDDLLAARAHSLLAASLDRLGLLTEALAHAADGVHLLPPDAPPHLRVSHTMLLALMSSQQLSGNGFRASFDQIVSDAEALPGPELLLTALNNYAWLLYERGEQQDADAVVARLQEVADAHGVRLNASALDTVARVLLEGGDLVGAERLARASIAADTPTTSRFAAAEGMLTLAEIRWRQGDPDAAETLITGAEDLGARHDMAEIRALALRQKSRLLAERERWQEAYDAATGYHDLWETIRSRETDSRAVLLQTVLNTDEARRRSAVYEELAERDPLTGLWNRRRLDRLLPALLGEHDAGGLPMSLAIVDLDRFKDVNDTHDHQVGDAVLCRVAELVAVAEPSFAVRLGGDEFLLVLPGLDESAALALAEGVRHRIEEQTWPAAGGPVSVTVSIGVATSASSTPSDLLRSADANMYRAKRAGRNRVTGALRDPVPAAAAGPGPRRGTGRGAVDEQVDEPGRGIAPAGRAVGATLGRPLSTPRHSAGPQAVDRATDPALAARGRPRRLGAHVGRTDEQR